MNWPKFVIVHESRSRPVFYTGWAYRKRGLSVGQFSELVAMAQGYATQHQARIGRSKLLKSRPNIRPESLVIKEVQP